AAAILAERIPVDAVTARGGRPALGRLDLVPRNRGVHLRQHVDTILRRGKPEVVDPPHPTRPPCPPDPSAHPPRRLPRVAGVGSASRRPGWGRASAGAAS